MLRIAMLSYHTCPLATLGGKDTGGMNVYVRDLTTVLGRLGTHVEPILAPISLIYFVWSDPRALLLLQTAVGAGPASAEMLPVREAATWVTAVGAGPVETRGA